MVATASSVMSEARGRRERWNGGNDGDRDRHFVMVEMKNEN